MVRRSVRPRGTGLLLLFISLINRPVIHRSLDVADPATPLLVGERAARRLAVDRSPVCRRSLARHAEK